MTTKHKGAQSIKGFMEEPRVSVDIDIWGVPFFSSSLWNILSQEYPLFLSFGCPILCWCGLVYDTLTLKEAEQL
jgi:hypothetical protein